MAQFKFNADGSNETELATASAGMRRIAATSRQGTSITLNEAAHTYDHLPGYDRLVINPKSLGTLEFIRYQVSPTEDGFSTEVFNTPNPDSKKAGIQLPDQQIRYTKATWLITNSEPGVETGMIARRLPPDLGKSFPVCLASESSESKWITQSIPYKKESQVFGKGPHAIEINSITKNIWEESEQRTEDTYTFNLTANLKLEFLLTEGFRASIHRTDTGQEVRLIQQRNAASASLNLEKGDYELRIRSIEVDDQTAYQLRVAAPKQLAPGLSQVVNQFPSKLTISNGADALIELQSLGAVDIKASLLRELSDGKWELIAENDDRDVDRNFLISKILDQGKFQLLLKRVGQSGGAISVTMTQRKEEKLPTRVVPFKTKVNPGSKLMKMGLTSNQEGVTRFNAFGKGKIGMVLTDHQRVIAEGYKRLVIPLRKDTEYDLLFWNFEGNDNEIEINAQVIPAQSLELDVSFGGEIKINYNQTTAIKIKAPDEYSYTLSGNRPMFYCARLIGQQCLPANRLPIGFHQGEGWVVVEQDDSPDNKILVEPFGIEFNHEVNLTLGQFPVSYTFSNQEDNLILVSIESPEAEIGTVIKEGVELPDTLNWEAMQRQSALTLATASGEGDFTGKMWLTNPDIKQTNVRLRLQSLELGHDVNIDRIDRIEEALQPGMAQRFHLGDHAQILDLVLMKGLGASYIKQGETMRLVTTSDSNRFESIEVAGGSLVIFNISQNSASFRLEKRDQLHEPPPEALSALNRLFEHYFSTSGRIFLDVEEIPKGESLFVDGKDIVSHFLHQNGHISSGNRFDASSVNGPGILEIIHPPGFVQAWLSETELPNRGRLGDIAISSNPMVLATGMASLDNTVEQWRVNLKQASLIEVAADAVGVTYIVSKDTILATKAGNNEAERSLTQYLPAGRYTIITKPIPGAYQLGSLHIKTTIPTKVGNLRKPMDKRLIRKGENQAFSFQVTDKQAKVGIGVETESDFLDVSLYTETFQPIAKGPLIISALNQGSYIMVVRLRESESPPVQYRPVVYGASGSVREIPEEIIKKVQQ